MCKSKEEGGQRCGHATLSGHSRVNLKAKEQYWSRKAHNAASDSEREHAENMVQQARHSVEELEKAQKFYGSSNITHHDIPIIPAGEKVIKSLRDAGLNPLLVGGSVRDNFLNLQSKDVDIEVYGGNTEQVIKALRKTGKVDEVGKSFGVLKVRIGDDDIDVSLPRTDNKLGEGHRGFEITVDPDLTPERASQRRDYTINALMYDPHHHVIIDPNNGLEDMKLKQLRHVSAAFDEDPLRVLRGVQMASRFGFTIAPETVEKAKTLKHEFAALSNERVRIEFQKLYSKGKDTRLGLKALQQTGWDECFPGLAEVNNEDLWRKVQRVDNVKLSGKERQVYLSAVVAGSMAKWRQEEFLLKTVNNDTDRGEIRKLIAVQKPAKLGATRMRQWSQELGNGVTFETWCNYQEFIGNKKDAANIRSKAEKLGLLHGPEADLVVGKDIIAMFPEVKPGKWVGNLMAKARDRQYENVFRTKEDGLEWMRKNYTAETLPS